MNVERGFRRVTLIVSVVVGIGAWHSIAFEVFDRWEALRSEYEGRVAKADIATRFWSRWGRDGFVDVEGRTITKRDAIRLLLTHYTVSWFDCGKGIWISASDVFPGVNEETLSLPPDTLEEVAQAARTNACFVADPENPLAKRSRSLLVVLSIACGIPAGTGAFVGTWLLFFLMRWIGRGFTTTVGETSTQGRPRDLTLSSSEELSETNKNEPCACTGREGASETRRQPMTIS